MHQERHDRSDTPSPRPRHRGARLAIVVLATLVVSLGAAFAGPVGAAGTGSISGTVTDATTAPVANATVTATNTFYGAVVASTTTDGAGAYSFPSLAAANYKITFAAAGYATQYYSGTNVWSQATVIALAASDAVTADAVLQVPASISGRITSGPNPLPGMFAIAVTTPSVAIVGGAASGADGTYTINGLAPGDYKVLFADSAWVNNQANGYRAQFASGVDAGSIAALPAAFAAAATYSLPAGGSAANVDAAMFGADCDPAVYHSGVNLTLANLSGKKLQGCDFTSATLTGANLTNANLTNARLAIARLGSTNLQGTTLTGVSSGAIIGTPVNLNLSWRLVTGGYLVGPGAYLANAYLTYKNLSGMNLTGTDFTYAALDGTTFTNSNLSNATLSGASVNGITLTNANLSTTSLSGVMSSAIVGTPASLPVDWQVVNGYLLGPGAITNYASFAGVDLSGANLTGAKLFQSDFTGANLANVDFMNAWLTYGSTFTNADLSGTNLAGADLTDAVLTGATGTPTGYLTTTYGNTTCPTGVNSDANGDTCQGQPWP